MNTLNFQDLKSLSFEKIKRLQNAKFRAAARYLLPETKFYSKLFKEHGVDPANLKTVEDWQKQGLPLVKKFYYMKNVKDFIVQPKNAFKTHTAYLGGYDSGSSVHFYFNLLHKQAMQAKLRYYYDTKMPFFSGGTQSGKPTPTFITHEQLHNLQKIMGVAVQMMSPEMNMRTTGMNLFPYGPHLAWHAVHTAFNLGVDLNLATAAGGAMRTKDLVEMAGKFKANVFSGMAEYIANRFLPMAAKKKIKLGKKAIFINGSEKMEAKDKLKIIKLAKKLGAKSTKVLDFYGASELKESIMPECTPGSGFHHIAPLSTIVKTVIIEKMTKKDKPITEYSFSDKGGAAVIWNINGAGTIMHGYMLGDNYSKIEKNKCPNCGLNTERIKGVKRLKLK